MQEEEKINNSLKLIAKSAIVVFIGIIISKFFTYLFRIIIARYFGPESYGLFSLAVSISSWFVAFALMGLSVGLLRFIPFYKGKNQQEKVSYTFKFIISVVLISGILLSSALYFSSEYISIHFFHDSSLISYLKYFSFFVFVSVLTSCYLSVVKAYERIIAHTILYNIILNASKVILLVILIFIGIKSDAITFSYIGGTLITLFLTYIYLRNKMPEIFEKSKISKEVKKEVSDEILGYSLPLLLSGVAVILFSSVDSFMIGYFYHAKEVGLYNAALPIAMLLSIVPTLFIQLFFPLVTKEFSCKNLLVMKELSKQVTKWIFIINLPIMIIMLFFPGAVINFIFGSEYLYAQNALRFLAIAYFTSSTFVISDQLLSIAGKSKLLLLDMIFACTLNIILNYLFIPMQKIGFVENSMGINGASIATMTSTFFLISISLYQTKRNLSIVPLRKKMVIVTLAGVISLAILFYLKSIVSINILSVILLSSVFCIIYFLFIFIMKGLDRNDFMIIDVFRKRAFSLNTIKFKTPNSV